MMHSATTSCRPRRTAAPLLDFSPMAALGFMLIAFFMVNANLQKPSLMTLFLPDNYNCEGVDGFVCEPPPLTLLCAARKIYFYEGFTDARLDSTDYSAKGLRSIILQKMARADSTSGLEAYFDRPSGQEKRASRLTVVIKLTRGARYGNLVDVIDEMRICRVRRYNILDISKEEERFIQHPSQGLFIYPVQ